MIVKVIEGNIVHIRSDAGKRIRMKNSKFAFNKADEEVGKQHEWEEVDEDAENQE